MTGGRLDLPVRLCSMGPRSRTDSQGHKLLCHHGMTSHSVTGFIFVTGSELETETMKQLIDVAKTLRFSSIPGIQMGRSPGHL